MGSRSPSALAGVFVILLLTVMGFAAFSATPVQPSATTDGVTLSPTTSGRIAATALGSKLATPPSAGPEAPDPGLAVRSTEARNREAQATAAAELQALETTTTTTAAPTTTTAPETWVATTTTAPPTTTSPPTTTTAPPTTTTTTTTSPPTTTRPPPNPGDVERWRGLVTSYFSSDLVEDALRVIQCESRGDPSAYNASSAASGLFQFIPSTWASARSQSGWHGADVFDPEANIAVAAWLVYSSSSPWTHWTCKP